MIMSTLLRGRAVNEYPDIRISEGTDLSDNT